MTSPIDVYGRGVAFPPAFSDRGRVAESVDVDMLDQSIRVILGTTPGERVMRPEFGCPLNSLAFAPNNGSTANLARLHVESALSAFEPRIELLGVDVYNDLDHDALIITVRYRPRSGELQRTTTVAFALGRP